MSKILKQLSIFINNSPGALAATSEILKACNINIVAFNLAENAEFGIIRIIVKNPEDAYKKLVEKKVTVRMTEVVGIRIDDNPGALLPFASLLGGKGINIEYAYAFATLGKSAAIFTRVNDPEKAVSVLEAAKISLIEESEI